MNDNTFAVFYNEKHFNGYITLEIRASMAFEISFEF